MRSMKGRNVPRGYTREGLEELDGRVKAVREMRARWGQLAADRGGAEGLSYQEGSFLWRFVFLESWLQGIEQKLLNNEVIDEARWLTGLQAFTGFCTKMGLARRAKPIKRLAQCLQESTNGEECSPKQS